VLRHTRLLAAQILTGSVLTGLAFGAYAAVRCESMTAVTLTGGRVTSAQAVAAGRFAAPAGGPPEGKALYPKLPAFCRVDATLKPSPDSDIRIEVWLPAEGWNGKLVEGGNGAYGSTFSYGVMAQALQAGYAATSSNTGHDGNSAAFVMGHPEKLIDWAYRAVHENAVAAKAIVRAHYGNPSKQAYFEGCSTGGRQAYGEAQRYPADFNGIVAGDPGINLTHQTAAETWVAQQVHRAPGAAIPASKFAVLHAAALAACDERDGVKDGVIENPLQCKFDPDVLLCAHADAPDCLTAAQVETARDMYRGAVNSKGEQIFPGLMPGSEMGWSALGGPAPMDYALDSYKYLVMKNPNWDYLTLDLDRDVAYADRTVAGIVNNADPNLKPFFGRGGKLLGYHGSADPGLTPLNSVNYYESVARALGGVSAISNSYRLFLVPGMLHCGGGDGTSSFDMIAALDQWVQTNQPPESIPASRVREGKVDRTRPLCAYPKQAVYQGSGSTDDAANFACGVGR
jgi:feruloyl esterase